MPRTKTKGAQTIPGGSTSRAKAWRQTFVVTLVAVGVFVTVSLLPESGSSLHSRDFHAGGKSFLEFCAPGSPQFAPVDRVRSPVELEIVTDRPLVAGETVNCSLRMTTATGKPVVADDLFVVHTEKVHLLVINSALDDYQHLHPVVADDPGEFRFSFRPLRPGTYRMFADFTPRATGRSLYAGAVVDVAEATPPNNTVRSSKIGGPATKQKLHTTIEELEFTLIPNALPVRINQAADLTLKIRRSDGFPLRLEKIMDAAAHMVAFDAGSSGFAHLHPTGSVEGDSSQTSVGVQVDEARLKFALQLSDPGYYRLWAQVKIEGEEVFASFGIQVQP